MYLHRCAFFLEASYNKLEWLSTKAYRNIPSNLIEEILK